MYDALITERPYKRAWSHEDSVSFVREMRGTQFDPRLTDLFLALMDENAMDLPKFVTEQEKAASDSPYVLAQSRVNKALH
jgi:HD-GYP domain-containing protein (c-di-GMP phosphodiesterase class II)